MQERMAERDDEAPETVRARAKELRDNLRIAGEREAELQTLRAKLLHEQRVREKELELLRATLRDEYLNREKELQAQFAEREVMFADREKMLLDRQRHFEREALNRQKEIESLRDHVNQEIASREAAVQQAGVELQREKERYTEENRKLIERTSQKFVSEALELLETKERQFHRLSKMWAVLGALALGGGLLFFGYVTFANTVTSAQTVSWEFIVYSVSRGLIAVALLVALSRYAFLYSNAYMREALKNADRTHAINFGKFYLQSYGAAAEWAQVKDAFANWNAAGPSAFTLASETSSDLIAAEKAASLLEKVAKALPKPKGADSA